MDESLREQLRLLERLFDAKLKPINQGLADIKADLANSHTRIFNLEKDVTKLKNRSNDRRAQAELHIKRWHVWAVVIAAGIYATALIVATAL